MATKIIINVIKSSR